MEIWNVVFKLDLKFGRHIWAIPKSDTKSNLGSTSQIRKWYSEDRIYSIISQNIENNEDNDEFNWSAESNSISTFYWKDFKCSTRLPPLPSF